MERQASVVEDLERTWMGRKSAFRGDGAAPLVALSANSAWNILNLRRSLVEALKSDGYRVGARCRRATTSTCSSY